MSEEVKTEQKKVIKKDPRAKLKKPKGNLLILKSSPHLKSDYSIKKVMQGVLFALLPATIFGVVIFGLRSLLMIGVGILSAVLTELIFNYISKKEFKISEGTSVLTGLLLVLTLPPSFPIPGVILGSVVAIFIGKMIFGGMGYNIFNPALIGRAFLQASYPTAITTWTLPKNAGIDAVTGATPLGLFKFEHTMTTIKEIFLGNVGGCIGETSALLILLGGIFILIKKYADWRIPLSYIGTVFLLGGLFWLIDPVQYP
ncbi:MAG: RnfABCDGE type electron transport complex subunit D, partial [Candidatus Marinimicrobia bacterium]|nr:RnfABCDGE type electron transport complex subunit D [Candidatus Neomarinimicrobiota bacterium]